MSKRGNLRRKRSGGVQNAGSRWDRFGENCKSVETFGGGSEEIGEAAADIGIHD